MSKQKDNDDSKKASNAATNLAFSDDENLMEQEPPQIQVPEIEESPAEAEQQKDTIKVPEHDPLDDSGVFSPVPPDPSGAAASSAEKPAEKSSEKSPSSTRSSRRSPSVDKLKAGAGSLYKSMKEVVKTVLRSSSSSPKKETDEKKQQPLPTLQVPEVKEEKKKRSLSMMSMRSIETVTDSQLDSGMTESSNLPESETFDKGVPSLPLDESVDNLAAEGVEGMATDVPEADDPEMETDLPESDKYKLSDVKKDGDDKKDKE